MARRRREFGGFKTQRTRFLKGKQPKNVIVSQNFRLRRCLIASVSVKIPKNMKGLSTIEVGKDVCRNSRTGDTERYSGTNTPEIMDLISQNLIFNYLFNDSSARKKSVRFLVFVDKHYVDYVPKYNRSINHASCWKHHAKERR